MPNLASSSDAAAPSPLQTAEPSSRSIVQLSAPRDLWERIRRGAAMPTLDNDLVRDREQWYANRPDYIERMTERSRKYLFHIVEELELRNMPTELALLPFIESAFNPQAVSSAKAAGMWQFMPATGKHFDLKQNIFRDDRRDVLASTRAALDYLQRLYAMFGDWHLALAAYNWGEGNVQRAIARNTKAGLPGNYESLRMPAETRLYVPKLQAVKNIVFDPDLYGSKVPVIPNHPYFDSVTIHRDIDVTLAAKLADVALDDFKSLNPSMSRPVILAAGTPQILLPWDNAEIFQKNLAHYKGQLATWTAWVAPKTLHPKDAAQMVGMSESELRQVNTIPPRMLIKTGSTLLVHRKENGRDVNERIADTGAVSFAPEIVLRRVTVKAGKKDTVSSIATKYKVSAENVAQWNKLSSVKASFKPGQSVVLMLPGKKTAQATRTSTTKAAAKSSQAKAATKSKKK
ncbi:transglycosylase SLT domain-containing protein [Curvibacter sp. CHRR-16]|uniref:transglycosylase SLT domain-containing protein n=1 Tax=Curvibacter sp. CHRR-16 TaxID=2835872 RepID=UPI00202397D5|nr:transglycosylase SLT domain-containing protein [Curvibacter sp. CHRR-16]